MGLDLLDTPVRLTWDFPATAAGQGDVSLPAVADAIVDAGVFFATLQGRPLLHQDIDEVLSALAAGCQLLVTCCGHQDELDRLFRLQPLKMQILLDVSAFIDEINGVDVGRLLDVTKLLREGGYEPYFALTPLRKNLCNIPALIRFCSDQKIARFKLPNAHIGDSFDDYKPEDLPRWQDLDEFRKVWLEFLKTECSMPVLEIHDLFLWEILTPNQQQNRAEYGGCQAANSLGHVDCEGVIHPCAAWPHPLGRLPEQTLEEIWSGKERLAVREHISQTPSGCQTCRDLNICFGGCRGLAYHLNRADEERDLMCSGPR